MLFKQAHQHQRGEERTALMLFDWADFVDL